MLHFAIFLCGISACLLVEGIIGIIQHNMENYTDKRIKETLNEMYNPRTLTFDPSKCEKWDIKGKKIN